jgi:hypothetical protein
MRPIHLAEGSTRTPLPAAGMFRYRIPLTGLSDAAWRSAFKRPPRSQVTTWYHPDHVTVRGRYLLLETSEIHFNVWIEHIQKWIAWANRRGGLAESGSGGRKAERGTGTGRARRR